MKSTSTWDSQSSRLQTARSFQQPAQERSQVCKPSLLKRFFSFLAGNSDPVISQSSHDGQPLWHVYDPQSRQHLSFSSETEVRHWLEQRYYQ